MTKPIISVAIMQLIEKGQLKLDDLAESYIPEMKNLKLIILQHHIILGILIGIHKKCMKNH